MKIRSNEQIYKCILAKVFSLIQIYTDIHSYRCTFIQKDVRANIQIHKCVNVRTNK